MLETLLVVVTAIATLAVSSFFRKRDGEGGGFTLSKKAVEKLEEINAEAEEAQEEIKDALDGPSPEEELAKLGNRRER